MDSGATMVFLPGSYTLKTTVLIRGNVRRVIGVGGAIDYFSKVKPDFRIADGESPVVSLEHFAYIHGGIEIDTQRTIVFRSVSDCDLTMTSKAEGGELFFEDFVTHDLKLKNQKWLSAIPVVHAARVPLGNNISCTRAACTTSFNRNGGEPKKSGHDNSTSRTKGLTSPIQPSLIGTM